MEKSNNIKGWFYFEDNGVNYRQKGKCKDEQHAVELITVFFCMLPKKIRDHIKNLDENAPEIKNLINNTEHVEWNEPHVLN